MTISHTSRRLTSVWAAMVAFCFISGCEPIDDAILLPARNSADFDTTGLTLVARIFHISDTHIIDALSPSRFAEAHIVTRSAWRPYEQYSTQLMDGVLRVCNRLHASGSEISFVLLTGDTCDNAQLNELDWMLGVFDGESITPLSGPDDRTDEQKPPADLDPYATFIAQGLYRKDVHGDQPSIPWYTVFGNHDVYAVGIFPIFEDFLGHRTAPLPLPYRPGIVIPTVWDPTGFLGYGKISPARPGPPNLFELPQFVEPNPDRRFFSEQEYIAAMFETQTGPAGHGFESPEGKSWYSISPVAGLRLIGLNTSDATNKFPGFLYMDGAISPQQLDFLKSELDKAQDAGELVIVASHHPSAYLREVYGTAATATQFHALLNEHSNVILHLAGHSHANRVSDRIGYTEIETCSTLDLPQEGRMIEVWRDDADGNIFIAYRMFSHLDDDLPALGADALRGLRARGVEIAASDTDAATRQKELDPAGSNPKGTPYDRDGVIMQQTNEKPRPKMTGARISHLMSLQRPT